MDTARTYIVYVYCDLERKYKSIVDVPQNDLVMHEFGCIKSKNEYVNVLIDINKTRIEASFHFLVVPQSTEFSNKYTNITNQYK